MGTKFRDSDGHDLYLEVDGEFLKLADLVEKHVPEGRWLAFGIEPNWYMDPGEEFFEAWIGIFTYDAPVFVESSDGCKLLDPGEKVGLNIDVRDLGLDGVRLHGGIGADRLIGSNGDDQIKSNGGHDDLRGAGGNDDIEGGEGAQIFHGGGGNDDLAGWGGRDVMTGGAGSDEFIFWTARASKAHITDFKPGKDTVRFDIGLDDASYKIKDTGDGCKILFIPEEDSSAVRSTIFLDGIEGSDLSKGDILLGWLQ